MGLSNDERGWVMTVISGIACTVGASIICVDLIIRQLPRQKNFKIENSNAFMSCGLSLSFGVMIFTSLYSMLPEAREYFQKGGMTKRSAVFSSVGLMVAGSLGIAVLSRIVHQFIPHEIVDCDHEHDGEVEEEDEEEGKTGTRQEAFDGSNGALPDGSHEMADDPDGGYPSYGSLQSSHHRPGLTSRPSLHTQMSISTKVSQLMTGSQQFCDENGQCKGFSDPCGVDCFRNIQQARNPRTATAKLSSRPLKGRTQTAPHERERPSHGVDESSPLIPTLSGPATTEQSNAFLNGHVEHNVQPKSSTLSLPQAPTLSSYASSYALSSSSSSTHSHSHSHAHTHALQTPLTPSQHHHHVPKNIFYSIGLQTSIAIALHKIPEGFITYATNHANPSLGVPIFLALFIHNITEGFAMALPLYLAIRSRWKAMVVATVLGGISQPVGAGVAALSFRLANGRFGEGETMDRFYGGMFASTAGIMAMVGLQLFSESLDLTHSRPLCFASAILGMAILGLSSGLTAK